jgi:divalent metal cation (Fe/Co/Zn/Cd) transporter
MQNNHMFDASIAATSPTLRRVRRFQLLTIAWMSLEALIALYCAWTAHSPALLGFGGDSAVELLSAMVVLLRFRSNSSGVFSEKFAARVAGGLLFVVAAFVLATSVFALSGVHPPQPSVLGIILLIASAIGMPWLASQKRRLATQTASAALKADATESALCGYLALIALAGLLVNAFFQSPWADPIAALGLIPFIVKESYEAVTHASRPCCAN